jgi:hypothetical protein
MVRLARDGTPSLRLRFLILVSIYFWTDIFVAGSACHMQGAIAFADWILQKLKVRQCPSLRETNVLVHYPSVGSVRIGAPLMLLLPVIVGVLSEGQRRNEGQFMSPTVPEFHQPLIERRCWLSDPYRSKVVSHLSEQDNSY